MKIKIHLRSKTTFLSDSSEAEVHDGQKIAEVAQRLADGLGCTVEKVELLDPVEALRQSLKENLGFVEAWRCHLSDAGKEGAAQTVLDSFERAREIYLYSNTTI